MIFQKSLPHPPSPNQQASLSSVQQMQDCLYTSYELPPRIINFLQKKSGITKNPLKTGVSGGKNFRF
jgi:hypothetical protein